MMESSFHNTKVRLLRYASSTLAVALLVFLLHRQGWTEILTALRRIPPWYFAFACGLTLISRAAISARWYVLLRAMGADITFIQSLRLTFAGLFASNFLPSTVGGDIVRLGGAMQLRCNGARSAASLILDRVVGMCGMAFVIPFGFSMFLHGTRHGYLPMLAYTLPVTSWHGNRFVDKWLGLMYRVLTALRQGMRRPQAIACALLLTWIHMLCTFLIIRLLLNAMGDTISLQRVAALWGCVYFVTLLPISFNGLGVQEVAISVLFSKWGGIAMVTGLTLAMLYRTLMMFASLPGAMFLHTIVPGQKEMPAVTEIT